MLNRVGSERKQTLQQCKRATVSTLVNKCADCPSTRVSWQKCFFQLYYFCLTWWIIKKSISGQQLQINQQSPQRLTRLKNLVLVHLKWLNPWWKKTSKLINPLSPRPPLKRKRILVKHLKDLHQGFSPFGWMNTCKQRRALPFSYPQIQPFCLWELALCSKSSHVGNKYLSSHNAIKKDLPTPR